MNAAVLLISSGTELTEKIINEFYGSSFRVEIAQKNVLALELLKNNDYHMIMLDMDLNGGDAFELLHKIKLLQYPAGVVLVTPAVKADDMLLAYDLGAVEIVTVGFGSGTLAALVSKAYDSIDQGD